MPAHNLISPNLYILELISQKVKLNMRSLLTQIPATLFLLLPLTIAAPSECSKEIGLPGGVYLCSDTNFSGNCEWHSPSDKCHNFITNRPLSVGPDAGGYCLFYEARTCSRISGAVLAGTEKIVSVTLFFYYYGI